MQTSTIQMVYHYLILHLTISNTFTHILSPIVRDISNKHLGLTSRIWIVLNKWDLINK